MREALPIVPRAEREERWRIKSPRFVGFKSLRAVSLSWKWTFLIVLAWVLEKVTHNSITASAYSAPITISLAFVWIFWRMRSQIPAASRGAPSPLVGCWLFPALLANQFALPSDRRFRFTQLACTARLHISTVRLKASTHHPWHWIAVQHLWIVPGSLAALAGQQEQAANPFVFGSDQYRGQFQVPDKMMAMEVGWPDRHRRRHWAPSALGDSAFDFFWNFGTITFSR
jgi:hypothetical protein